MVELEPEIVRTKGLVEKDQATIAEHQSRKVLLDELQHDLQLRILGEKLTLDERQDFDYKGMKYSIQSQESKKNYFTFTVDGKQLGESPLYPYESLPVQVEFMDFAYSAFHQAMTVVFGRLFDVVLLDPPWKLATSTPDRGPSITYPSLRLEDIFTIPLHLLREQGFVFIRVLNTTESRVVTWLHQNGFEVVERITWVKTSSNGKLLSSTGRTLQHV